MKHILAITARVLTQIKGDKRYAALTLVAPLIIIFLLKLMFDAMQESTLTIPDTIPLALKETIEAEIRAQQMKPSEFILPMVAFIVHFLSFLLCALLLVSERTWGTLDRMLISGYQKPSIIAGYALGYFGLATVQTLAILLESLWLFELDYGFETLAWLFLVIWILAIVSVLLGIFISTFARNEGHVIPFIPLLILPTVFLAGLLVDPETLPAWANAVGHIFPYRYAHNIIDIIMATPDFAWSDIASDVGILAGMGTLLWLLASFTLKETD